MFKKCLLLLCFVLFALPSLAQEGVTLDIVNVRVQPSSKGALITKIAIRTPLTIEARNDNGDWLLIHTNDTTVRGWVSSKYVELGTDVILMQLPVSNETITVGASAPAVSQPVTTADTAPTLATVAPVSVPSVGGDAYTQLMAIPILPSIGSNVASIVANGQARGNNAHFFVKVGDSNMGSGAMLGLIGMGLYDLGGYPHLQRVVDFFSAPTNAFTHTSLTAGVSYTTYKIFGTADGHLDVCPRSTTLIECEYNVYRPSVALMQFLIADIHAEPMADFETGLRKTVQTTIDMGVVPVLFTFPFHPDMPDDIKSEVLTANLIVVAVANDYGVPLVNLLRATQTLPSNGLQKDHIHMQYAGDFTGVDMLRFNGEEKQYGYTLWNLLALQVLDSLMPVLGG